MPKPRLENAYCTQCRWLLRAAWMGQELLTTFEAELAQYALTREPKRNPGGTLGRSQELSCALESS